MKHGAPPCAGCALASGRPATCRVARLATASEPSHSHIMPEPEPGPVVTDPVAEGVRNADNRNSHELEVRRGLTDERIGLEELRQREKDRKACAQHLADCYEHQRVKLQSLRLIRDKD
jgi:hypothetical protein